jgi:hypothetical protein
MAHKRKDTYVAGEWARHLKPDGKRQMAKAERRHAKREISAFGRHMESLNYAPVN